MIGDEFGGVVRFPTGRVKEADGALARIEGYWDGLRAGRLAPARSEIDPRGMEGVLGHAMVLERVSSGLARLRVAGSHMGELLGMEARGLPLSAIFDRESRPILSEAVASLFDDPAKIRLSLVAEGGIGRSELTGHLVLLPLRSDLGDVTRALGAIALTGRIGRTPRRLTITGQSRESLTGYAERPGRPSVMSWPAEVRPLRGNAPAGSAEAPGRAAGHLRLVVVNDG